MTQSEFDVLKQEAEGGNARAQNELARHYWIGKLVEKDFGKAVEWWTKACQNGYACGAFNLAMAYYLEKGANKDCAKAVEWWKKAAQKEGTVKSVASADSWKRRADRGCVFSQTELGWIYYKGEGVEQDYSKSVEWWTKAAEQEFYPAQLGLGWAYYNGNGVPKDQDKAIELWSKADAYVPCVFGSFGK